MNKENQKGNPRRRTQQPARPKTADDVVFTQPKPFLRRRFVLHIATVLAVVLALILGMSIFFKVEKVTVSGMMKYTAWDIRQASGIQDGENLLSLSKAQISGNIMTNLPYISSVRVGIKLPGTVHIEVTEVDVTYAVEDTQGAWWQISSQGKVVAALAAAEAQDYTRILGIRIQNPQAGQWAVAEEPVPEVDEDGVEIPVTVLGSERFSLALQILQNLEANGILGKVATVDVTNMGALILWYGTQYQVLLGDRTDLTRKIQAMEGAIVKLGAFDRGILDVRFVISEEDVVHIPFTEE